MAVRLASFFLVSPLRIRFTISDRDYFIRLRVSVQVRCPPFLLGMEWLGTGIIPKVPGKRKNTGISTKEEKRTKEGRYYRYNTHRYKHPAFSFLPQIIRKIPFIIKNITIKRKEIN
jgi:hypothetical protein